MTLTATNCAEFIFLPDTFGTGPLLILAALGHAIPRMSALHQVAPFPARSADAARFGPSSRPECLGLVVKPVCFANDFCRKLNYD